VHTESALCKLKDLIAIFKVVMAVAKILKERMSLLLLFIAVASKLNTEVLQGREKEICANCSAPAGFSCSRCTNVKYCSKRCQRVHWKSHKASCKGSGKETQASSKVHQCPVCKSTWTDCVCEEKPSCWICLESCGTLLRGCACRGSAGYVLFSHCPFQ